MDRGCGKAQPQPSARPDTPTPTKTPAVPFVIRHFALGVLCASVAKSVFHRCCAADVRLRLVNPVQPSPTMPFGVATACRHFGPTPIRSGQTIRHSSLPQHPRRAPAQTNALVNRKYAVQPSPTQSNPVQPKNVQSISAPFSHKSLSPEGVAADQPARKS